MADSVATVLPQGVGYGVVVGIGMHWRYGHVIVRR
jgi:hypothetical protein